MEALDVLRPARAVAINGEAGGVVSLSPSRRMIAASAAGSVESTSTWRQRRFGYSSGATRQGPREQAAVGMQDGFAMARDAAVRKGGDGDVFIGQARAEGLNQEKQAVEAAVLGGGGRRQAPEMDDVARDLFALRQVIEERREISLRTTDSIT